MNRIIEQTFTVKGALNPDEGPYISLMAQLIEGKQEQDNVEFRCHYNKLNQITKAKIALAVITNLAHVAKESLEELLPREGGITWTVKDTLVHVEAMAETMFDIMAALPNSIPDNKPPEEHI